MHRVGALVVAVALLAAAEGASAGEIALRSDNPPPRLEIDTRIPMSPILVTSFSAVAVAVGAGFGWQAHEEFGDWEDARDAGDPMGRMDALSDDVRAHSIAANVLMFGGAIGAVVGIVWWVRAAKRHKAARSDAKKISLLPLVGPGGAGAIVTF